jgi:nucleoside-diphosphate-sugar epimerase
MGFLTRAAREEDGVSESSQLEQQYLKLFPKIGRDFVHREDLVEILQQILDIVDPDGFNPINLGDDSEARQRALEYKAFIEEDKDGSKVYADLIKLEEDDEDAE